MIADQGPRCNLYVLLSEGSAAVLCQRYLVASEPPLRPLTLSHTPTHFTLANILVALLDMCRLAGA